MNRRNPRPPRRAPAVLAALACVVCLAAPRAARAEVRPLTLYERTGRAPLIVRGEVTDGEHRFAVVKTLEIVKCAIPEKPAGAFRIAYKLDSFLRAPWQDKIEFRTGERVLLFLRKFTKDDGEKPEGDLYTLMWGAQGRMALPEEGERAWVEAIRAFARILETADLERQEAMLKEAAFDPNPVISDGAFEELLKQGLGDAAMIPALVGDFSSAREPTRILAMRLLRQILSDARAARRPIADQQDLSDRIRGLAAGDPSVDLRVEAVQTLKVLGGGETKAFLQRVAREDPSQLVRYEAERSLLGWKDAP